MERRFRSFYIGALAVIGVGVVGTVLVPKAHADAWDKKTIVTVNEPVIAGNTVLQPGTYVWKLLDSQSNRHIVQTRVCLSEEAGGSTSFRSARSSTAELQGSRTGSSGS